MLDPTSLPNGFYNIKLTATPSTGAPDRDRHLGRIQANPIQKAIHLPGSSAPWGIGIDPQGNYAYVVDGLPHLVNGDRVTFVYQIDVNPASPKFNSVVNTFYLNQSSTQAEDCPARRSPHGVGARSRFPRMGCTYSLPRRAISEFGVLITLRTVLPGPFRTTYRMAT